MAHPLAGEAPTELVVSDHSKIPNYAIGCIQENVAIQQVSAT
jgi:hypothetical protein